MYTCIHTAGIEFIFRNKITPESRLIIITLERDAFYIIDIQTKTKSLMNLVFT